MSYLTKKRVLPLITGLSVVSLLAACGPSGGYYDANGNYVSSGPADYPSQERYSAHPPRDNDFYANRPYADDRYPEYAAPYDKTPYHTNTPYSDPVRNNSIVVPENMVPPAGMCRVWFTQRPAAHQPKVESCDNIRTRLPRGAYVIYGG